VTTTAAAATPNFGRARSLIGFALFLIGCVSTVAATIAGNGNVIVAIAPIIVGLGLCAVWVLPLRIPLMAVLFLSLALDATDEGPRNTVLAPLGAILGINLKKSLPAVGLPVPGIVLIFALLVGIYGIRRYAGRRIEGFGRAIAVSRVKQGLIVSFLAVIALSALGARSGGDMQMAKIQVQTYVLVLLVAYLSIIGFRDVRDYRIFGRLVVIAGCLKALNAIWVIKTVVPRPEYATSHGDSLLFAVATVLLVVKFAEQPIRRNAIFCAVLLPLLAAGMYYNDRRLVWVEVLVGLGAYWLISRRSILKRYLIYAMLAASPLVIGYIGAGWNSGSELFAPVRTLRSVGDSEYDASTLYRDLENYNLLSTLRENMFLGTGFGHPFAEVVKLPDISFFKEYKYMPHNSVLGLWAFTGAFGFTALTFAIAVAVFCAARAYEAALTPDERVAAFMVIGTVLIYFVQCWGDIGFSERRSIHLLGPALAIAGQLAASTGVWRASARKTTARAVRK
jgi:hypothetical protein